ncbi:MAG: 5-(carboxyamino)imidazole ribonucleotide mutase [Desulfohalobiaceae bacterium]
MQQEGLKVAIFIGSASDKDRMLPCAEILQELGLGFRFTVASAHRTPERTEALIQEMEAAGCQVFICAAGMAAHLAGAVAARTTRPVLGVPLDASLQGWDSLLSTVQMPPGFPVGTMAVGKAGAKNAAWQAAQILALQDRQLEQRLQDARSRMRQAVEQAAQELEQELQG